MAHPDLFREAVKAARAGERPRARDLLLELVEGEPRNEMAWLWLSELVDDPADKIIALENALTVNPDRPQTRQRLEQLQAQQTEIAAQRPPRDLYAEARAAEKQSPSVADQVIAGKRRQAAEQLLKEGRPVQVTQPTTTLLRLAAGPAVMYGLLLFIHSGLNPLRTSPVLCLGGLGVALGSLLIAGVHNTPHHALWKYVLGQEGLKDAPTRLLLSILGLLFLAIPFVIILINAVNRLALYQATFSAN